MRSWLVYGLASALITLSACSGGGFNGNNNGAVAALIAALTGVSNTGAATGETAVQVDFTVQGEASQSFALLFQYFIDANSNGVQDANEPLLDMTEVSMALESLLGQTSDGDLSNFPPGQSMVSGTFLWQAGADLGFVGTNYGVVITPTTMIGGQSTTPGATMPGQVYSVGNPPLFNAGNPPVVLMGSIGPGGAMGVGRSQHTAALVSDLGGTASVSDLGSEVLAVGGTDGTSDLNNIDRFTVDGNTRATNASNSFNSQNVRIEHASASFSSGSSIRVLVTGGSVSGTATNTADVYLFGPSGAESVSPTGPMASARSHHAACWLPDNRIFVHGGMDAMGTALNSAEIYNPATGTFSSLTVPGSVPARVDHTQNSLPDGTVLIAGGNDGANNPLNAFIYDPKTDSWSDTGTSIDRVEHTSTLLVNGVCALVGGRTNAGTALNSATFYRTFAENFGGVMIPSGFTTMAMTAMNAARFEHGASRLNDGSILLSGGFGSANSTLATSEVFIPMPFTDPGIGYFTQTNTSGDPNLDLTDSRARHTQTTTAKGSAAMLGGATGTTASSTVLDTIEVFQFQNDAPVASNLSGTDVNGIVTINFDLADAEGDRSFVIVRYSTDGGATFTFATLLDFAATVNLAPGAQTLQWNAGADGLSSLNGVTLQVIPVGGVIGAPVSATF